MPCKIMRIFTHKNFDKKYKKLPEREKSNFKERRNLFLENPLHPLLNNHALAGRYKGCRSINVSGDLRVLYQVINNDTVFFIDIDTHSNLYV